MTELMIWKNKEIDQLRKELNQTFRRCCSDIGVPMTLVQTGAPLSMDLSETDKTLILTAELPDIHPEDLDISVTENSVTIRGKKKESSVLKGEFYERFEERSGSFSRQISLPRPVDVNKTTATYKDNVLELVMSKLDPKQRQAISIRVE
jgi:HSP20 family protein